MTAIDQYLDYWDKVFSYWTTHSGQMPQCEKSCWPNAKSMGLLTELMPNPYWGNPADCSAVIINLNPGGLGRKKGESDEEFQVRYRADDCHISHLGNNATLCGVMARDYRKHAIPFSLIKVGTPINVIVKKVCPQSISWYSIRDNWAKTLVEATTNTDCDCHHFALELCGWHSHKWKPGKSKNYLSKAAALINPLLDEAIPGSELGVGLAVGALFARELLPALGYQDITEKIVGKIPASEYPEGKLMPDCRLKKTKTWCPIDTKRWYKVLRNDKGTTIICTWSSGGNTAPERKKFSEAEVALIKACNPFNSLNKKICQKQFPTQS